MSGPGAAIRVASKRSKSTSSTGSSSAAAICAEAGSPTASDPRERVKSHPLAPLVPFLGPYHRPIALGAGAIAVSAVLGGLEPYIVKLAVDALREDVTWTLIASFSAL